MIKKSRDIKSDKLICLALFAPMVVLMIQYFFLVYFNLLDTAIGIRLQLISKLIVAFLFLPAFPFIIRRNFGKLFFVFVVSLLVFSIYYLAFPQNGEYIRSLFFPFFFISLPVLIYTLCIKDFVIFNKLMRISAVIIFLFGTCLAFIVFLGRASFGAYSMTFSYYMLLPSIVFIDEYLDRKRLRSFLFAFITFLLILALGSRGPVFCIFVFLFLKLARRYSKMTCRKLAIVIISLIFGFILLIYSSEILWSINAIFLDFGIKSRTIALFLKEGPIHLSGRDILFQSVWEAFMENPLLGIGLAGDRLILNGAYVHNFFVELLVHYGILFGGFIILVLGYFIIRAFVIINNLNYRLFLIFFSIGFVPLMVSSSYLTDLKFWIFLGIVFNNNIYRSCPK